MKNGVVWIVSDKSSSVARITIPGGKKVDITGYNVRNIPEGVVQGGVVYDAATLSDLLKAQLSKTTQTAGQKVAENQEIGEIYIVIPGDRVKTSYLYLEEFKPGELSHADVERIEETFGAPLTKLRFFPEEETKNAYIFHGIRSDILMPYVSIVEKLDLTLASILPLENALQAACSKLITTPTVVTYEKNGLKLFSATSKTTVAHKLWEIDEIKEEKLRDAIEQMNKDTEALIGVKPDRVLVIENSSLSGDHVEKLLTGMNTKLAFFSPKGSEYIDPIDMLAIKGMLTSALVGAEMGFAANPIDAYELKVKGKEAKLIRDGHKGLSKDYRVAFLSTLLAVVMLVIGVTLLWELYLKDHKNAQIARNNINDSADAEKDDAPDVMGDQDVNIIDLPEEVIDEPEPEPVAPAVTKAEVSITVLNGNGLPGEAKKVAKLVQAGGFKIGKTGNADNYNYRETVIIAPTNLEDLAEEVKGLVIGEYPLAHVETHEGLTPKVIVVVIGSQ